MQAHLASTACLLMKTQFMSAKGEGISGVQIELLSSSLYFVAITACVGQALRNGWEQQPGLSCS